jgi:hypothetical protein
MKVGRGVPSLSQRSQTFDINDFCFSLGPEEDVGSGRAYRMSLHSSAASAVGHSNSALWMPSPVIKIESSLAALAPVRDKLESRS